MRTVKGIYENGQVRLLEPINVREPVEVEVTFPDGKETGKQQSLWTHYGGDQARQEALEALQNVTGLLNDLIPSQLEQFEEIVARRSLLLFQ